MSQIPVELREILKSGECAFFVGAGLSKGLPNWEELTRTLANELGIKMDRMDPRIIAMYYENEFGRSKLEERIVSQLTKNVPLTKTHELLTKLPLKAIVTTNYDQLLEKALSEKDIAKIVDGTKAPQVKASQLPLIKMHGDLDDPSTIVITKKDYDEYPEKHRALITYLLGLLISCNFLFVGFSLEDPNFDNIYLQIRSLFGKTKRRSYAIFKNPSSFEIKRREQEGIEVIPVKTYEEIPGIFEELVSACTEIGPTRTELTLQELENIQETFCRVVERQNRWLDPRGIFQFDRMLTKREVELEEVYVVPRLAREEVIRKKREPKPEKGKDEMRKSMEKKSEIEKLEGKENNEEEYVYLEKRIELTVKEVMSDPKNKHMVILGDPGIGKSCLLRYIALKASTNYGESLGIGKRQLAVLIPLSEYAALGKNEMLREFIFRYINEQICSLSRNTLQILLERNSFLFLLDGLDEVVSESQRIEVSRQVERFMAQYPNTYFILTSRPVGYKPAALIGAIPHFTLSEFNDNEIKEFLNKWFAFLERLEEEKFDRAKIEEKTNSLARIILGRENILRLARNPLLLTILVLIHRVGRRLPERRAEFYEYAVKTVAGTWERWKSLQDNRKIPDQETIMTILEKIGFKLHTGKQENAVEISELKKWLTEAMEEELGHSSKEEINDFIWMLNERAGLLIEKGLGLYGFVHLTFQEYFAARYIACGRGINQARDLIGRRLYDSRWREVFLLSAAIAQPHQADAIMVLIFSCMILSAVSQLRLGTYDVR